MTRPLLLDLFCGAGGCAMGYHRAGFQVVGIDHAEQPNYPFQFFQNDALDAMACLLNDGTYHGYRLNQFSAIHASPPCQAYSLIKALGKTAGKNHPDLVDAVRRLLVMSGLPWVIENVVGAPLSPAIQLCGSMFGLGVRRHRLFESSTLLFCPDPCRHDPSTWPVAVWGDRRPSRQEARREHRGPIAVYGDHPEDSAIHRADDDKPGLTRRAATLTVAQTAMGIDWMTWKEITQAIPPAYTEYVGKQLMRIIRPDQI